MATVSTGEAIVRLLAAYNVDTVFGIPGVHTLEFYRGFGEGSSVRHVQARNELGAGFMADGYARSSGRPGVCLTISGPGVTNAATALGQAYADSLPLLLISAEAHSETLGKGRGTLHEVSDLNAVTRPMTAFSECVKSVEEIPQLIAKAFDIFTSKRPRPVHIAIPIDILNSTIEENWQPVQLSEKPQPDALISKDIAARLIEAKNAYIMVGGGAVGADIKTLAERAGAIVIASNAGKGIMPDSHPLSLGSSINRPETRELLKQADLILAIGTELSETDSYIRRHDFSCPLIRIDLDPVKLADNYPAEVGMVSDATAAVDEILQHMPQSNPDISIQTARVQETKSEIFGNLVDSEPKHKIILDKLREVISDDTFVMSDATQMTYSGTFMLPMEQPRHWQYASGFCALGFAFPNAIGAKFANPDAPVLAIAGDGGSMFTIQELITAAEQKLPIPLILWHNDGYKQIRDDMRNTNVPRIAVDGLAPDFETLAQAMHCHAQKPNSLEEFGTAVQEAFKQDRPTVIIVREDANWLNPTG